MHPKTVKTGLLDNDNPQRPVLRVGASDDAKSVAAARARLKDHLLSGALYPLVKVGDEVGATFSGIAERRSHLRLRTLQPADRQNGDMGHRDFDVQMRAMQRGAAPRLQR